jgi:putative membrane protein insertion efficiency factor
MLTRFFQILFKLYYWAISPLLGTRCRYVPSCSEYAQQALALHGPFKGLWLAIKRISRCHPWGGHGIDPVPGSTLEQDLKDQQ